MLQLENCKVSRNSASGSAMTGPTASTPSPHDLPASFVYHSSYDEVISYIAETDDVSGLDDSGSSPSTSTAPPTLDWPNFKNALKWKIKHILESFPENPEPLLHPAAIRAARSAHGDTASRRDVEMNGPFGQLGQYAAAISSSSGGSPSTSESAANALASRFSPSSTMLRHPRHLNGGDDSSSDESDPLDNHTLAYRAGAGEDGEEEDAKSGVISTFMAAKTRPPPDRFGSWGRRLSREEMEREKLMVFGMLDEFETSPPFTIQRLCELLLAPTSYVRSSSKFLASLARILAMTASHADFPPVSPGLPPNVVSTNGGGGAMDRTSGMVGPPSPNNEPIFSPIPFLRRGSSDHDGRGDEGAVHKEESVPPLSLASDSADKDEEMDGIESNKYEYGAPLVSDTGLVSSTTTTNAVPGSSVPQPSQAIPQNPPHPTSAPARADLDSAATTNSAGSTGPTHVPLGVPPGRVDELDQVSSTPDPTFSGNGRSTSSIPADANPASATKDPKGISDTDGPAEDVETSGQTYHRMDGSGTVHPLSSTTTLPAEAGEQATRAMKRLKSQEVDDHGADSVTK